MPGRDACPRLGITDVADLRSPQEVERRGPVRYPTVSRSTCCRSRSCRNAGDGEAPHETSWQKMMTEKPDDEDVDAAAERFMTEEYERFPTLGGAQRAVRQVVIAAGRGTAGAGALLRRQGPHRASPSRWYWRPIGVPRDAVLTDFLRSNDAVAAAAGAHHGDDPQPRRARPPR